MHKKYITGAIAKEREERETMTNEQIRQTATAWETAKEKITKRVLHIAGTEEIEQKAGKLEKDRIPDTFLYSVYVVAFTDDKKQDVTYMYVPVALRKKWGITEKELEQQFQNNVAKINFRFVVCNDLEHEIKRARLMLSVPRNIKPDFAIYRIMSRNRLVHNADIAFLFTEKFWGTVQDMFPSGCYLLLPSYTTILLIDKSADFAKVQLLLETVTDSTHRRFTLPDSSFTLDYEKHELHDKILLEHSIHCSFPQDDEGE